MQTRKQFLADTFSLTSVALLFGYSGAHAMSQVQSGSYLTFDLHCHPGRMFTTAGAGFGDVITPAKTTGEMNDAHLSGAFFALVADAKLLQPGANGITITGKYQPGEAWAEYKRQLNLTKEFFQKSSVRFAIQASDLKTTGSVAAYLSVEGGDFLEGQVDKLDEAYSDGIRSVQLVHYVPNDLGDLQTTSNTYNGLSDFGKKAVRKMNQLGILIDVAHASYQTTKDVVSITDTPIMLSHSILEMEPDRPIAKRAISKDHAKLVAGTGGLIGAWPSGFNKSFDEFVDNTLRLVELAGVDHVGIGTDMDSNFKPVLSSYSQYPVFAAALAAKGLSAAEVEKIMGGNAARLMQKVFKKK